MCAVIEAPGGAVTTRRLLETARLLLCNQHAHLCRTGVLQGIRKVHRGAGGGSVAYELEFVEG